MIKYVYLDTNIWLDYCLRSDAILPVDEFARSILQRSLKCEFTIVVSDIVQKELLKQIYHLYQLFEPFELKKKVYYVQTTSADILAAKDIPVHFPDNVHIAIAKRIGCDYFVTNDAEILALDDPKILSSQFF
jgi:predicted nucleic acid-binding protein